MFVFFGGLLGVVLVMYYCVCLENCYKIKGLLIFGLIVCVVGGIIELLEFLFLFVVLVLYVIYVLLIGFGFIVMFVFGVIIGNIDGNIIDFVVFGILYGLLIKWYMVLVVVVIWFVVYYVIFCFVIICFNLKILGCDSEVVSLIEKVVVGVLGKLGYNVFVIFEVLGGVDNIVSFDNCIICLCLFVKDMLFVNVQVLKDNWVIGVV